MREVETELEAKMLAHQVRQRADGPNPEAIIPVVPELQALIDELPVDRLVFIHSEFDQPFKSPASIGNRVRK